MQSKAELEKWYTKTDPWGYATNPDDILRKKILFNVGLTWFNGVESGLDIGAGEGFITDLLPPGSEFIEVSDKAAKRVSAKYKRVDKPKGKYDIILATGVLYEQYEYEKMREWIIEHSGGYLLTCHYDKAGICHDEFGFKQIFYAEFPYREGKQVLRVYDTRS